jgi:hypothetical protein
MNVEICFFCKRFIEDSYGNHKNNHSQYLEFRVQLSCTFLQKLQTCCISPRVDSLKFDHSRVPKITIMEEFSEFSNSFTSLLATFTNFTQQGKEHNIAKKCPKMLHLILILDYALHKIDGMNLHINKISRNLTQLRGSLDFYM